MLKLILGVLLTGVALYVGQAIVSLSLVNLVLVLGFLSMVYYALMMSSPKREQYILLRHVDGRKPSKLEGCLVCIALAALTLGVFALAYRFQIPALFIICALVLTWSGIRDCVVEGYRSLCKRKRKRMVEYQEEQDRQAIMAARQKGGAESSVEQEAMEEIYEDPVGL